MREKQKSNEYGMHPAIRISAGITALFMLLMTIGKANDMFGFVIVLTSLFVLLASFTKGKVSQFFGSCFGAMLVLISIGYIGTTIKDIWLGESIWSIFNPIMFALIYGFLGLSYAINTKFGFALDEQISDMIDWYLVTFDENSIYRNVSPPSFRDWKKGFKKVTVNPWNDKINWADIERVCFYAGDWDQSDEIHLFVNETDIYCIPTEANGSNELWYEIVARKLFDDKLAIEAMGATNQIFCTPELPEI